jgi:Chemoreceptor zinc-binding domain
MNRFFGQEARDVLPDFKAESRWRVHSVLSPCLGWADKVHACVIAWSPSMNFEETVRTHCLWKNHLLGIIAGSIAEPSDPEIMGADDKCALGLWLHGEARTHSHLTEYLQLMDAHSDFHRQVAMAVKLVNAGKCDRAKFLLETGKFNDASVRVIKAIQSLQQKVRGYGSSASRHASEDADHDHQPAQTG